LDLLLHCFNYQQILLYNSELHEIYGYFRTEVSDMNSNLSFFLYNSTIEGSLKEGGRGNLSNMRWTLQPLANAPDKF